MKFQTICAFILMLSCAHKGWSNNRLEKLRICKLPHSLQQSIDTHTQIRTGHLSLDDKRQFANTLQDIFANKKINQQLRSCLQKTQDVLSPSQIELLQAFIEYSYKTSFNARDLFHKIEHLQNHWHDSALHIKQHEKLTTFELRTLASFASFDDIFQKFQDWFDTEELYSEKIKNLRNHVHLARNFHDNLHHTVIKEVRKQGLLFVAYDFKNDFAYRQYSKPLISILNPFAKILGFHYEHLAFSIPHEQNIYEAHMWGQPSVYRLSERSLISYRYTTFAINHKKLVSKHQDVERLKKLYGTEWVQKIESLLLDSAQNYFINDHDLERLYNSKTRRIRMIFNYSFQLKKKSLSKQSNFSKSGNTTCSEFILKSFFQCIDIANQKIAQDWENLGIETHAPQLKLKIRSHSKVEKISPQTTIKYLLRYGVIEPQKKSQRFYQFIRES